MRAEQLDIKALLKQVYQAHTTKIKGLEDEVEDLKNKLLETDKNRKNAATECKRCGELEEAFKSCQAALNEQSKWFENLGQKFSVFDNSEKAASKLNNSTSNETPSSYQLHTSTSVKPSKMNLLRNLMSLTPDEYQDSLDLCTPRITSHLPQDYSTFNSDSVILAPDTMGIIDEQLVENDCTTYVGKHVAISRKTCKTFPLNERKHRLNVDDEYKKEHNAEELTKECQVEMKPAKKRSLTSSDDSDSKIKRLHKSSVVETDNSTETKMDKYSKKNNVSDKYDANIKPTSEKKSPPEMQKNERSPEVQKPVISGTCESNHKNKNFHKLDVHISKDASETRQKSILKTKNPIDDTMQSGMDQVSPSLIPVNEKKDKRVRSKPMLENEDIYDFQTPLVSKKTTSEQDDSSWTTCNKRKVIKGPSLKVKSTSKYKMSLDALPPNYKKPNYRQTKLSKSIFQPKATKENNASCSKADAIDSKYSGDIDATCIPDNYEYQITSSGRGKQSASLVDETKITNILFLTDETTDASSKDSLEAGSRNSDSDHLERNENIDTFEDFLKDGPEKLVCVESMNSFDRLPKKEEPNYKYKEETVRKKADRKQLNGFDCKECEKYYAELGLTDKEKQSRLKQCSRHRSKYAPPPTPEHFWELEFPDTQECKARGYLNETQKVKLKTHRRRPL